MHHPRAAADRTHILTYLHTWKHSTAQPAAAAAACNESNKRVPPQIELSKVLRSGSRISKFFFFFSLSRWAEEKKRSCGQILQSQMGTWVGFGWPGVRFNMRLYSTIPLLYTSIPVHCAVRHSSGKKPGEKNSMLRGCHAARNKTRCGSITWTFFFSFSFSLRLLVELLGVKRGSKTTRRSPFCHARSVPLVLNILIAAHSGDNH